MRLALRLLLLSLVALSTSAMTTAMTAGMSAESEALKSGAVLVSAAELKALYRNNVVTGVAPSGYRFNTEVASDGITIPATDKRGAGIFVVVEDGKGCMRFADLWEGKLRCWTYYRQGNAIKMYRDDGAFAADITTSPRAK